LPKVERKTAGVLDFFMQRGKSGCSPCPYQKINPQDIDEGGAGYGLNLDRNLQNFGVLKAGWIEQGHGQFAA
jgi:hypothetical protein